MENAQHLASGVGVLDPERRLQSGGRTAAPGDDGGPRSAPGRSVGRATKRHRVVGTVGLALAVGLGGFATLMHGNATFAEDNVARQLSEQEITFKPAGTLTPEEQGRPCLVKYAGKALTTGEQARCYANQFIGVHLKAVAGGKTFSQMRVVQDGLRAQIAEAQARNDPSVVDLQRQLGEATGKRQTLFEGETVRGLLMTSYAFGVLGSKAGQAATAASWAGLVVLGLSLTILVASAVKRPDDR